jgi:hypothetical protein
MLIAIIFLIISLVLIFFLTISNINISKKKTNYPIYKLILSSILYLLVAYILADFYSFNPIEVDELLGTMVNPYVAIVSLVLQFFNIVLLVDTWYKVLIDRLDNKFLLVLLTVIFNIIVIIGNIFLDLGYNGGTTLTIYTNVKFITKLEIIILYIPYVLYDLNLINIIFSIKKGRKKK